MGGHLQQISCHLPYDWEKPRKTSVMKPSGAHSSATSHCFKWGPFPPNEVGRISLPVPLSKPIRVRPEERAEKNWHLGSEDPEIFRAPLRATPQKSGRLSQWPSRNQLLRNAVFQITLNVSVQFQSRPRWSSGYHTRFWIRGSRVRSRPGSMYFSERKNHEYDFLRKGSKAVGPVS